MKTNNCKYINAVMQNILHHASVGIHVIDKSYKTIIYNENMSEIEGLESEKVIGRDLLEVFPALDKKSSTLLKAVDYGLESINIIQSYKNIRGEDITSINTTVPLYDGEEIIGALEISNNMTHIKELSDTLVELQKEVQCKNREIDTIKGSLQKYSLDDLVGQDSQFLKMKKVAKLASKSSSSVLIYGETGTGKEIFAQGIHYAGDRASEPFIAQNCAAIPESLLEGILFGTEQGSFTGAILSKGIFEQANGGTLLLDEINSMSIDLQAKLLRVLQENYIRRVGGKEDIPIDVRIIATSNEDPIESVKKGIIRKDLFYRLNVISIKIPELKERREDIPLLINHFIFKHNRLLNKQIEGVEEGLLEDLKTYPWPGNVRELENTIESAMNLATKSTRQLSKEHFLTNFNLIKNKEIEKSNNSDIIELGDKSLNQYLDNIEKKLILKTLRQNQGNITRTAERLGISRQSLQYKLNKYSINTQNNLQ